MVRVGCLGGGVGNLLSPVSDCAGGSGGGCFINECGNSTFFILGPAADVLLLLVLILKGSLGFELSFAIAALTLLVELIELGLGGGVGVAELA